METYCNASIPLLFCLKKVLSPSFYLSVFFSIPPFEVITLHPHHSPIPVDRFWSPYIFPREAPCTRTRKDQVGPKTCVGFLLLPTYDISSTKTTLCLCLWRKVLDSLSKSCWIYRNTKHWPTWNRFVCGDLWRRHLLSPNHCQWQYVVTALSSSFQF